MGRINTLVSILTRQATSHHATLSVVKFVQIRQIMTHDNYNGEFRGQIFTFDLYTFW